MRQKLRIYPMECSIRYLRHCTLIFLVNLNLIKKVNLSSRKKEIILTKYFKLDLMSISINLWSDLVESLHITKRKMWKIKKHKKETRRRKKLTLNISPLKMSMAR